MENTLILNYSANYTDGVKHGLYLNNFEVCVISLLISILCLKIENKFTQILKGILAIFLIKYLTEATRITTFSIIVENILSIGPIVVIIIFQPEIRSALQYLGRRINLKQRRKVSAPLLASIEKALLFMSKRKIGCLITMERLMNLDYVISTGTFLDAYVTGELLMNIFTPKTPLHDGAVIIRGDKIIAASTYLPMSDRRLPSRYGTRHRAALGISEVSDSITLVISEESGEISVAYDGNLMNDLTLKTCLQILNREMSWM